MLRDEGTTDGNSLVGQILPNEHNYRQNEISSLWTETSLTFWYFTPQFGSTSCGWSGDLNTRVLLATKCLNPGDASEMFSGVDSESGRFHRKKAAVILLVVPHLYSSFLI